ncbi:type II toxin-antitoxin system PemK/MazF family toxin [Methanofollis formosanus]|uniref:Type II toxin-antitoxin system PemK/MazF family toxin n=1 Tax=Methanofollis formosanus TaxID=299308 RepID=A0A8G1A2G5_9EURY|nr:type II toxin-antitoxin system PemK/MazF family toxin [Methanofollis formosanus]QYZ79478.1 type II toxin-antitoxin system PemK/MazF family toxin [Methanofollis formosanus]
MAQYSPGDVVLAPVRFGRGEGPKVRPAVIVGEEAGGFIEVCPVSSTPPTDAPFVPIDLDDFAHGGLDLFEESYVLTAHLSTLRCREVRGKKGRLNAGIVDRIVGVIPGRQRARW